MSDSVVEIAKAKVGAAFDRAAATYDTIARFQHDVCERLLQLMPDLATVKRKPAHILDAGCGTGYGAQLLMQHWPTAHLTGCDLSGDMLSIAAARNISGVCGDIERLPFRDSCFDATWSSLALQWCHPKRAFAELQRVLAPGGALYFSTLAPGTLHEIDHAFAGIDRHRHVLPFVTAQELMAELDAAGLTDIRLREETWVTRHADLRSLLATIRGIGANQPGDGRRRSMLGKTAWQTAQARYEALRDAEGLLPATYQVVFVGAIKP